MTDKELKRLSRAELLEMLLAQVEENEKLKARLGEMRAQLDDRQIRIDKAGSIAEAALQLGGVFEAAEAAAAQYLENIRRLSGEEEAVSRQMEEAARKKAEAIRAEADAYSRQTRFQADQYQRRIMANIQNQLREQDHVSHRLHTCGEEQTL